MCHKNTHTYMKTFLRIMAVVLLTALSVTAGYAQKKGKGNDNYNLLKAIEALQDERDEAKALELVNKQLKDTPDNVEALILRVRLTLMGEDCEYNLALRDINHAIKVNKPAKTDMPNSTLYQWKAVVYRGMDDWENTAANYKIASELARKEGSENLQRIRFDYAHVLFLLEDYDGADGVLRQMLKDDETDQAAMVGIARNMIKRGQDSEALALLDKCRKYNADYSEIYRFKMFAHDNLGETSKAIDAGLDWLEKDEDASIESIVKVLVKKTAYAEGHIKARARESDEPHKWKWLLSILYKRTHKYAEAVKIFDELEASFGEHENISYSRSQCYRELGLYPQAIADITTVIRLDGDWLNYCIRADCRRLSGDLDSAIVDFSTAIEMAPDQDYPYYKRGWCYEMKGDRKRAMADYNTGIELDGDYPYTYLMRGELYLKDGNKAAADADFEMVLQKDTLVEDGSCRMYALHFLGRDKEAEEWMDKLIALDPDDDGGYYNRACLYALMGRLEESLAALRTAFEKGYRSFSHIRLDDDMDSIRDLPEFKALIREYEAIHEAYLRENEMAVTEKSATEDSSGEVKETVIAMKRSGGTFKIPCEINGLPLQMVFDSGAAVVSISSLEANFMLKNGYLSKTDVKGTKYFSTADGAISPGTVITLRNVKLGDAVLENVEASVTANQTAPLLLGQSALERFGTITIDNINNQLIIKR